MRRAVTLNGHDHEVVRDRRRRRQEPARIRRPSDLAGRDRDGVDVAGVVAEERRVTVDRDAGSTDRAQRDRRVPHGLARIQIDRRDMGIERTSAGWRRRGTGRARARRGSRARPGRRVAEPLRVDQDPPARRRGDGRRHGWSVVPVDRPPLRPAPEVRGDDLRGADGDRDGPVGDGLRETEVAVRAAEGNVEMPRSPIRRLGRIGERSRVARVALRLGPAPDRLGGGSPQDEPASPDHHGGEDDRAREEAASTCGNEPGVAQSRAILGGTRRSDARPAPQATGASRMRSTNLAGPR